MFPLSKRLPGENNKSYSYRVIKEGIMSLELFPGQALNVNDLAERLKTSTTPIKEEMGQLQREHLVEIIPQVGTYVSKINSQLIKEAAFMRFILERETIKLACDTFPREGLLKLKKNLDYQELLLNQNKFSGMEFQKLDEDFHSILFYECQRIHIWGAIMQLSTHYNRMILLQGDGHFHNYFTHHKEMISIIENKETDQIENILKEHIFEPIKGLKSLSNKYFDVTEEQNIFF